MARVPGDMQWAGRAVAASAVAVAVGSWVLALVLGAAGGHLADALTGSSAVAFAVVGALVVWQRPGNVMGPLFCAGALGQSRSSPRSPTALAARSLDPARA